LHSIRRFISRLALAHRDPWLRNRYCHFPRFTVAPVHWGTPLAYRKVII